MRFSWRTGDEGLHVRGGIKVENVEWNNGTISSRRSNPTSDEIVVSGPASH